MTVGGFSGGLLWVIMKQGYESLEWSQEIKLGITFILNRVAHLKFGRENEDHYWPSFQRILSSSSTLFACLFFERGIHNMFFGNV